MAVTPAVQLARANDLLLSEEESDWRLAARSAYYACFHALKKVQQIEQLPEFTDVGVHQSVIDALINSNKSLLRRAGIMLNSLRGERVLADYELDVDFTAEQAKAAVELAERIEKIISPQYSVFE